MVHAFTVDVEDYFQVETFASQVSRDDWGNRELRVEANTRRMLSLLDETNTKGTFFILGWVADRVPGLIKEIADRGHEIGTHSYWHRLVYSLTPEEFAVDLKQSIEVIQTASGVTPRTFRAPTFSITTKNPWAYQVLRDHGITLDSSVYPIAGHDRYGIPDAPRVPYEPIPGLIEAPMSTAEAFGRVLPFGGGGYLRIFPFAITKKFFDQSAAAGRPVNLYIHPWEIDPGQPQIPLPAKSRFRHYHGIDKCESRLRALLKTYKFGTLTESLASK
jgi:polysaccharide deacetylase family protein (PEP-CTERM system associated)